MVTLCTNLFLFLRNRQLVTCIVLSIDMFVTLTLICAPIPLTVRVGHGTPPNYLLPYQVGMSLHQPVPIGGPHIVDRAKDSLSGRPWLVQNHTLAPMIHLKEIITMTEELQGGR